MMLTPDALIDKRIWLKVDVVRQQLSVMDGLQCVEVYPISTALAGCGQQEGSGATPLGWHYIRACIGRGCDPYTVFKGRRPTGEYWSPIFNAQAPDRDWILGRIFWLCGLVPGVNRGGHVDSQRRFIYIHGTPDDQPMNQPLSHGCIRMRVNDVVRLFDQVPVYTPVLIHHDMPSFLLKSTYSSALVY